MGEEESRVRPTGLYHLGDSRTWKATIEFAELTYEEQAVRLVYDFALLHLDPSDEKHATFALDEVYVVSFSYVLGNWRAMVSTSLPDGMYYEVTYIRELELAYVDAYKRSGHKELHKWTREVNSAGEEQVAKKIVYRYIADENAFDIDALTVHLLSFTHIRRTWKAFLVSNVNGEIRYEVSFDGVKSVAYLDTYKLFEAVPVAIPSREGNSGG